MKRAIAQGAIKLVTAVIVSLVLCSAASAQCALGSFWGLIEVFSNADGSVQFVMLQSASVGGKYGTLAGRTLAASDGSMQRGYTFASDPAIPSGPVLVATQGFADLQLVKPDFIMPDRFLPLRDASVSLTRGGNWCQGPVHYDALPTDGLNAFWPNAWGDYADSVDVAYASNNAGQSYQFVAGALPSPPFAVGPGITGTWYDPLQSGHGLSIEVLSDNRLYASWFAFNPAGTQQAWFTGLGTYSGNTATIVAVEIPTGGRWIPNFDPGQIARSPWGTLTFIFTDCNHGRVDFNSTAGYGAGSMNLTRLTQPAELKCP